MNFAVRSFRQLSAWLGSPFIVFVDPDLKISHFQSSHSLTTVFLLEVENDAVTCIYIGNSTCLVNLNPCLR